MDLAIDVQLADASGNELGELRAVVEDEDVIGQVGGTAPWGPQWAAKVASKAHWIRRSHHPPPAR